METDYVMLIGILLLLVLLFLTIFIFAVYSGLFIDIIVKTCKPNFSELEVAYKFARGPYRNSSELFTEAHAYAPDQNCIGIYYDDPRDHQTMDGLRYMVGVILNTNKHVADEKTREKLLAEGYKIVTFPAVDYVVMSTFPFRGTLSIMIGVARVYPELREYIQSHKLCAHPFIEIYDDKDIHFLAPLSKQNEFYIEEMNVTGDSDEGNASVEDDDRASDDSAGNSSNTIKEAKAVHRPFSFGQDGGSEECEKPRRDSDNSSIEILNYETAKNDALPNPCDPDDGQDVLPTPVNLGTPPKRPKSKREKKSNLDKSSSSSFEELHMESNND